MGYFLRLLGGFLAGAFLFFHQLHQPVRGDRQVDWAHAQGIGDRIGQRRDEARQAGFPGFLRTDRSVRVVAFYDADLDVGGLDKRRH
ncbi:MAG: hypothetical protein VW169_02075, partial [Rhodospirillaceae bacterium]